ncbi:MAG: hypothetical protein U0324_22365 [Polyangiales bacterium]
MENKGAVAIGVIAGLTVYLAFLGAIVALSIRWSKGILKRKSAPLSEGLTAAGATLVRAGGDQGLYTAVEDEYDLQGTRLFTSTYYASRSLVRNNLRVDGGPFPHVTLFPEGAFERFGKSISLNREVQLGDESFDRAVYIDTAEKSDERVRELLAGPGLREGVRALLAMGFKVQFSLRGVTAFRIDSVYAQSPAPVDVPAVLNALARIVSEAPRFDAATLSPAPNPLRTGYVIAGASVGVGLLIGALGAAASGGTLDPVGPVPFVFGAALWGVFMLVLVAAVRGRSDALQHVLLGALVGVFALPMLGGFGLVALNSALDGAPAERHTATVLRMHRKPLDLHVTSWRPGRDEEAVLTTGAFFQQVKPGDRVEVRVHPGRFGWAWTDRVDAFAAAP